MSTLSDASFSPAATEPHYYAERVFDAATPDRESRLSFGEPLIRRTALQQGPRGSIVSISWRQICRELWLRHHRRIDFRRRGDEARAAYDAMRVEDFVVINARQSWANWRTIPRNLDGRLPARPVFVVDLCCGVGDSSAVLAYYCAAGSHVLGLEWSRAFVDVARGRIFRTRSKRRADVTFHAQNVLETFCNAEGRRLADRSVDVINAGGAVGCHFDVADTEILARECARVIRDGGMALIDSGRDGTDAPRLRQIFATHGFHIEHRSRSCVFDRYEQLCLRKAA